MLGYLFLFIALIAATANGYCGKRTSSCITDNKDALFVYFIRMVYCVVIGFVILCVQGEFFKLAVSPKILLITILSGVTTAAFVFSWLLSVRCGAYMMLDVFLMLGVIVPLSLSSVFFNENIRIKQWIGLAILFIAVLIMCSYNNQIKEKINPVSLLLLILCGISNGLADFSQKLFVTESGSVAVFNFYTYVFAALFLFVCYIIAKTKCKSVASTEINALHNVGWYILAMSVCLFLSSFFKTLAAGILPSAKLYPLNQGASLILSAFMSRLLFKEKLTVRCIIGVFLSFIGLIMINIL